MNKETIQKYRRAGKIASEAREYGLGLIKEGATFLEVATHVETWIRDHGAGIAFPINISRNDIAAHYSPWHEDPTVFHHGDCVKLDVGVHIDGFIADTAATIEVGTTQYTELIAASRHALDNAITAVKKHSPLAEIGKTIEETIWSYGYKSIDNLTGHSLERYVLHSGITVPNVADIVNTTILHAGDVIAIEPFASTGAGHVIPGEGSNIYLCTDSLRTKLLRNQDARKMVQKIHASFHTLPFAERWCTSIVPNTQSTLKKLVFLGAIKQYPQLIDRGKGMVSQAEHTVLVTDDGCEVMT